MTRFGVRTTFVEATDVNEINLALEAAREDEQLRAKTPSVEDDFVFKFYRAQKTPRRVLVVAYGTFSVWTGRLYFACSVLMFVLNDKLALGNPCGSTLIS
jgi:hypothetical protein